MKTGKRAYPNEGVLCVSGGAVDFVAVYVG